MTAAFSGQLQTTFPTFAQVTEQNDHNADDEDRITVEDTFYVYLPFIARSARFGETGTPLAAGGDHTCALTVSGGVECWGGNSSGQLGDGTVNNRSTPVDVVGLTSGVQAIALGSYHTCALTTAGGVKCWGWNGAGQLGNGTNNNSNTPVDVSGLTSGVQAIALGSYHTCALTTAGGVKCWGWNGAGQLGNGTTNDSTTPVDVSGLTSGVRAITVRYANTCALTSSGGVKCWGWNLAGQLGDGTYNNSNTPVDVSGLTSGVQAINAGHMHTCALTTAGGVKCWGLNSDGQLGNGTNNNSNTPVDVYSLTAGVQAIAAGGDHNCALTASGGIKCWGWNGYGQLGNNSNNPSNIPVDVVNWP
jgi:alpha-tubulin suppressor-like RCC1 family protein